MRRLSDDKARRLSALVWRERLQRWLPIVVGLRADRRRLSPTSTCQPDGPCRPAPSTCSSTTAVSRASSKAAIPAVASIVYVHLDDGRDVEAFSHFRVAPPNGAHVVVAEARHASGRVTYDVVRLFDQ